MKVVDVQTHRLNDAYLGPLKRHGGGYTPGRVVGDAVRGGNAMRIFKL
jgi:hypothetical protein